MNRYKMERIGNLSISAPLGFESNDIGHCIGYYICVEGYHFGPIKWPCHFLVCVLEDVEICMMGQIILCIRK